MKEETEKQLYGWHKGEIKIKKFIIKLDNGFIRTSYYKKVPKGVKKFDKLRLELKQDGEKVVDYFMIPEEALLIVTALMRGWLNSTEEISPYQKLNQEKEK